MLQIDSTTLRRWDTEGKIKCIGLGNNYRHMHESEINKNLGIQSEIDACIYARVSSHDQKEDLNRQIKKLRIIAPEAEVFSDVMSGMNFKIKSFMKLIEMILNKEINRIYITHKDRMARFGYDQIEQICEIIITDDEPLPTAQEEMAGDLISIITSFSAKLYGFRSHKTKKILEAVKS